MEKRLAASMAGLAELTTLRERHRREMEDLLLRLTVNQQQLAAPKQVDNQSTPWLQLTVNKMGLNHSKFFLVGKVAICH